MVLGNKFDLSENRQISYEEGINFAEKHKFLFIETSAKTNFNINEAFETLIRKYLSTLDIKNYIKKKNTKQKKGLFSFLLN